MLLSTISSGRALAHRASTQPRFRGLVVAEGRLLGQWREELTRGAPGRGVPPLAPNLELLVLSDDRQIAGQIRRFDRATGRVWCWPPTACSTATRPTCR